MKYLDGKEEGDDDTCGCSSDDQSLESVLTEKEDNDEAYVEEEDDDDEDSDGGGEKKTCEKCHEVARKFPFKSKNFDKNCKRIKTVYFCSIDCFKDFENWKGC